MNKEEMSLIILDSVIKGIWCSNVGGQIALETISKANNDNQTLRYLERATKTLTDVKYCRGDDMDIFLQRFLGKFNSMEEANLLLYGTHVKVAVEISNAVNDIVPRPVAIINPETGEFALNQNEFYAYGIVPSTITYRDSKDGSINVKTKMINKYLRLPEYLKEKYDISLNDLENMVSEKIKNPNEEADLEASEEFYRNGLIKIKKIG